jgi:hydroxypyruvate isomerase
MNRRKFTTTLTRALAGACGMRGVALASSSASSPFSFPSSTAQPADTPIKLSVMLWTVFTDLPFEKRLEKIAEAGYRNVQLVGEYSKWTDDDFQRANAKRKELGITFDCTAGLKHGICNPAARPGFLAELRDTLPVMERLSCHSIIVLSGDRVPEMSREAQHQSCTEALKAASAIVDGKSINGEPVRLLLETIDPQENPLYFLTEIIEAFDVVQAVGHPQVQVLYDFYHQQIAGGNLITKLEKCIPHLGLVHIADVPGRHEPGTGEINYQNIFRKLAALDYKGTVAMEFHPSGDPVAQLRAAREMALNAYTSTKNRNAG